MASPDAPSLQANSAAGGMGGLIRDLLRPYRGRLVVILLAMPIETAMSLTGPWPLKVILDNAVGARRAPEWLVWLLGPALLENKMTLAARAALGAVLIAALGASDGVANPLKYFFSFGVGRKDVVPGRPLDEFGVGFYYAYASTAEIPSKLRFGNGWGFEAYYNFYLTPRMQLTPDIQLIQPSQKQIDRAVVTALRLRLVF